jgi:hypothetical protein
VTLISTQWHTTGWRVGKLKEKQIRVIIDPGVTVGEGSKPKLLFSMLAPHLSYFEPQPLVIKARVKRWM